MSKEVKGELIGATSFKKLKGLLRFDYFTLEKRPLLMTAKSDVRTK